MTKLRVIELFAGIGGFSLGLERTGGFVTVAFCEIDKFARRVLAKHWPEVPCYDDVTTLVAERLAADGIAIDVMCAGFPCQDLSFAGKGAGLAGKRSGLYREVIRLAGELRPRVIILENVSALLSRGLGEVLGDLATLGYDAEWHCIPASYVGAHHRRDRIWIIAYLQADTQHSDANGAGSHRAAIDLVGGVELRDEQVGFSEPLGHDVADAQRRRLQGGDEQRSGAAAIFAPEIRRHRRGRQLGETWRSEPDVGRVAHGVPDAVDRIRTLGNAVVPQIPELIGRAILTAIRAERAAA